MPTRGIVKLPILHAATPPQPEPFPVGSKVYLQSCPHGIPGVVIGHSRGRVHVSWPGWNLIGRYKADRLVLADDEGEDHG